MPEIQVTPPPVEVNSREPTGPRSFLIVLSTVIGIVIGIGVIVGGLGKAFFVEREEWNRQTLAGAEDKVTVNETLKRIDKALTRQEEVLDKLTGAIDVMERDIAVMRGRGR
jgi:hypothetical protein